MGGSRGGGTGGLDPPPWNCQIINFCHVEIFRQTPSGNLDPPPLREFSGSAHAQKYRLGMISNIKLLAGLNVTNLAIWVKENITCMRMTVYCHSATMLMLGPSSFLQFRNKATTALETR